MAKRDSDGNLVTSADGLKSLYLETYQHRLRHRTIESKYDDILHLKHELWNYRLINLNKKVSSPWKLSHLDKTLKSLKNNQARDPMGVINELFKPGIIGDELKFSTLSLMNSVKQNMSIPTNMRLSNNTTIYKSRGSRLEMSNDRSIFVLTVMRKFMDKLTYLDKYPDIDLSMSRSNIGARKNRNIRDHLFIIHGVINSVIQGEITCMDIKVYDLEQCLDAL